MSGFRRSRIRFVFIAAAAFAVLAGTSTGSAEPVSEDEKAVIWRTNHEHYLRKIHKLETSERLSDIAREHACEMAQTQTLRHSSGLGDKVGGNWRYLGENVGTHWDLYDLHLMWMDSPDHRDNILDWHYDYVGAGVCVDLFGTYWVAVVFMG